MLFICSVSAVFVLNFWSRTVESTTSFLLNESISAQQGQNHRATQTENVLMIHESGTTPKWKKNEGLRRVDTSSIMKKHYNESVPRPKTRIRPPKHDNIMDKHRKPNQDSTNSTFQPSVGTNYSVDNGTILSDKANASNISHIKQSSNSNSSALWHWMTILFIDLFAIVLIGLICSYYWRYKYLQDMRSFNRQVDYEAQQTCSNETQGAQQNSGNHGNCYV
uniref:Uncharacterized protein n=1 Tax=Acrobeloides nanus TaxID=290746 RepID=A0A914DRB8_9BILA